MQRKRGRPQSNKPISLEEFVRNFDPRTLNGVLRSFESREGWMLLQAYAKQRQREFEVASLDLISKGQTHPAAHASGYAQACEDFADKFIEELNNLVLGRSQVVESPPPEEANL